MKRYYLKDWENIYDFISTKDYIKNKREENYDYILDLIMGCEFDIEINKDGTINLIDLQDAYLGGVESYKNFKDIFDACTRLEGSFLCDYYNIYYWE